MSTIVVYVTTSTVKEARKISDTLVRERHAACVSIVPRVDSTFWWKNKIEHSEEALLIIKTRSKKFRTLVRRIQEMHSYSVPEILALPVLHGNPAYLEWLRDSVK